MQLSATRHGFGPEHMSIVGEINERRDRCDKVFKYKTRGAQSRPRDTRDLCELIGALISPGDKLGSAFSFWLPLTSDCTMELPAENMTPRKQEMNFSDLTPVVQQHPHLLLVEDNKVNQIIIK